MELSYNEEGVISYWYNIFELKLNKLLYFLKHFLNIFPSYIFYIFLSIFSPIFPLFWATPTVTNHAPIPLGPHINYMNEVFCFIVARSVSVAKGPGPCPCRCPCPGPGPSSLALFGHAPPTPLPLIPSWLPCGVWGLVWLLFYCKLQIKTQQ